MDVRSLGAHCGRGVADGRGLALQNVDVAPFIIGADGPDALLFASLWLLAELARGSFFTGFPSATETVSVSAGRNATVWLNGRRIGSMGIA